jgi:hypothetical protein
MFSHCRSDPQKSAYLSALQCVSLFPILHSAKAGMGLRHVGREDVLGRMIYPELVMIVSSPCMYHGQLSTGSAAARSCAHRRKAQLFGYEYQIVLLKGARYICWGA